MKETSEPQLGEVVLKTVYADGLKHRPDTLPFKVETVKSGMCKLGRHGRCTWGDCTFSCHRR